MKRLRDLIKDKKGAALVEFAIVLPLLLLLIFGMIEFSILFYNQAIITNASREGARFGIVYGEPRPDKTAIETRAESYCKGKLITFGDDTPEASVINDSCSSSGGSLTVSVTYDYEFLLFPKLQSFFSADEPLNKITLEQKTVMRCE